jgi:cellobiose phosphorylase
MPERLPPKHPLFSRLRRPQWRARSLIATLDDLQPALRAPLLTAEQMRVHGRALAARHQLDDKPRRDRLLSRLVDNESVLGEAGRALSASVAAGAVVTPAAEWLLDNLYLIEQEIAIARRHLPAHYSRELPRLRDDAALYGPGAGQPRIWDLALNAVAHGDGRLIMHTLSLFLAAYQETTPLRLGELWAFPIMLRLALIENLRRAAVAVVGRQRSRDAADAWATRMLQAVEERPGDLILIVADLARSGASLDCAFVAEMSRRLQGRGAALAMPLSWLDQQLARNGQSVDDLCVEDGRLQAEWRLSVANSIGSLRLIDAGDWRAFVEAASAVERVLREDPARVYAAMDFTSRDGYRHAVEALARRAARTEVDVARAAVQLAREARAPPEAIAPAAGDARDPRERHVGYYLVGHGRHALEDVFGLSHSARPARAMRLHILGVLWLTCAFGALAVWFTQPASWLAQQTGDAREVPGWMWLIWLPVVAIASSQLAMAIVNWLATLFVPPRRMPRMDFPKGLPASATTLVVVPTLLGSADAVDALLGMLEVQFLANRDPHLRFALLTDLPDASHAHQAGDDALVQHAAAGVAALNASHAAGAGTADRFFLLHRERRWNERERCWMGHERKRGKLAALNALLRGRAGVGDGQAFTLAVGNWQALSNVRYVITLDSDTELPQGSAVQMVAAMAHPLQRARFGTGAAAGCVAEGHAVLQPRTQASLPGTLRSRQARLLGADAGIDPYTHAVSDVYQDLFDEGSFVGKGIYDVDAFDRALTGRLPDGRILSHDLIEGCHARSGLLSDVTLFEQVPDRYAGEAARVHRWTRGDWQLLPWLFGRLRVLPGTPRNPLSMLSRLKLLDNLRRSLVPPSLLAVSLIGWTLLQHALVWTLAVVVVLGAVPLLVQSAAWLRRRADARGGGASWRVPAQRLLQQLALLPDEARLMLDAIARTLWRLMVSRRRLLEWTPSAQVPKGAPAGSTRAWWQAVRAVPTGPLVAVAGAAGLVWLQPSALWAAAPLLGLWALAPLFVWWCDQPPARRVAPLSDADRKWVGRVARRTWAFFEAHGGLEDHSLPPDNVQLEPVARTAHRTSPTNIGLSLLAPLAAHDLGYVSLTQLMERIDAQLTTLERLERYRGHFFNWYDTKTLAPLAPRYISTVDSGNLVASLLVLRAGLLGLADEPVFGARWCQGVRDTLALLLDAQGASNAQGSTARLVASVDTLCDTPLATLGEVYAALETMHLGAAEHVALIASGGTVAGADEPASERLRWSQALTAMCRGALDDLTSVLPAPLLEAAHAADSQPLPSLRLLARHEQATPAARQALQRLGHLADRALALTKLEYGFLYDPVRRLLSIGWHVDEQRLDAGHYDLLASEARLGIYAAIAEGDLPPQAWFALGRNLTSVHGQPVLLSWSGSMFEYLMPALLMPQFDGTLLEQSCRTAVQRQIEHAQARGVPWGVSESGYNATDSALNYQYKAFGTPGLGLKRGLDDEMVVAPYASMMALIVEPGRAAVNLRRLADLGAAGSFGYFEALDFTPARLPPGQSVAIVRSYMAHHQGMALLGMAQALAGPRMQARFAAAPALRSALPLLHELPPTWVAPDATRLGPVPLSARSGAGDECAQERRFTSPDTPMPEVQLLSNGRLHLMLTQAGSGSSRWQDVAVTRWREDATRDHWGSFCYLRDLDSGKFWSTTYQPTLAVPTRSEVVFSAGQAEYTRLDHGIETRTVVAVTPEDDVELRRVRLRNRSRGTRSIELTSYAEIALASPGADAQHPAFNKLFVQTELLPGQGALLAHRRPRSASEVTPWMFHLLHVHGLDKDRVSLLEISHETDRARFIGRGSSLVEPQAMLGMGPLSNTAGAVLDPVAASRCVLACNSGASRTVDLVTGMAASREACLALIDKYRDRRMADRVFELAWTHAQVMLHQLGIDAARAQLYARIAGMLVFAQATMRADEALIRQNRRGQSGLWGYSISGDLPIVLVTISDARRLELVRQLVQAHAWWRNKGLAVDLVIWNEERDTYRQRLHEQILGLVTAGREAPTIDRPGGVYVRHADQIAPEDRVLLMAVARAVFSDQRGTLAEQLAHSVRSAGRPEASTEVPKKGNSLLASAGPRRSPRGDVRDAGEGATAPRPALQLDNGHGGFAEGAREYVVAPPAGQPTPAPWCNVIANERLGCVLSESGSGYTWFGNAHEYRLTPWDNDPITDSCGEAIYLRDEGSGTFWSPTPLPAAAAPALARHGFGYSRFEQTAHGVQTELTVFVHADAPVRFSRLRIVNRSGRTRRLSVTAYVEWVLGSQRAVSAPHVVCEPAAAGGALLARNGYAQAHANCVAFLGVDDAHRDGARVCNDRTAFIGRNGSLRDPRAMRLPQLVGRRGAALDPCGALQVELALGANESHEVVFRLGAGDSHDEAVALLSRFGPLESCREALQAAQAGWRETLDTVQVETPDPALDALVNGWLPYQTIACRLWARSGFYQSGGAYGFRDQLQDAMALVHNRPALLREQLLRCASRQFVQGDVQHWWHPPQGQGVRTACSDDYLWLPLALARYWRASGDAAVLGEIVPFLEGRPLAPGDESYYDLPQVSGKSATLYQHARLAVEYGLRFGQHGLPLMGSGDWNDGMNRVGHAGRGESVWLGFFLAHVLREFAPLAHAQRDDDFAARCDAHAATLMDNIERHAWDGAWYLRAWFDDGTPLGSAQSVECRIDLIAQSWAVLAGAPPARTSQALDAMRERLVDDEHRLVRLLEPPFDGAGPDPGYIAGYVPGVRENGGQYTHGAVWAAMALAEAGRTEQAWELFNLINPLSHARDGAEVERYKVEPYVVAGDVYAVGAHAGRGGWTWYTGSAGWMYRLLVESLLGLRLEHDGETAWLLLQPRLPRAWPGFGFTYRGANTCWQARVRREPGATDTLRVDGAALPDLRLPLHEDGQTHAVELVLPA